MSTLWNRVRFKLIDGSVERRKALVGILERAGFGWQSRWVRMPLGIETEPEPTAQLQWRNDEGKVVLSIGQHRGQFDLEAVGFADAVKLRQLLMEHGYVSAAGEVPGSGPGVPLLVALIVFGVISFFLYEAYAARSLELGVFSLVAAGLFVISVLLLVSDDMALGDAGKRMGVFFLLLAVPGLLFQTVPAFITLRIALDRYLLKNFDRLDDLRETGMASKEVAATGVSANE